MDPSFRMMGMHLYDGHLKILPIQSDKVCLVMLILACR